MNYRKKEKEEKNKGISTVSFKFFPFTDLFLNVFFFSPPLFPQSHIPLSWNRCGMLERLHNSPSSHWRNGSSQQALEEGKAQAWLVVAVGEISDEFQNLPLLYMWSTVTMGPLCFPIRTSTEGGRNCIPLCSSPPLLQHGWVESK